MNKSDSEKLDFIYNYIMAQSQPVTAQPKSYPHGLPFEVAPHDEDTQTWYEAMTLRENGWRLPTKEEAALIAPFRKEFSIGDGWYWTSTENNTNYAWIQRFSDGNQYDSTKNFAYDVRCVRG